MDPMTQMLNGLPDNNQNGQGGSFMQPQPNMFSGMQPPAPQQQPQQSPAPVMPNIAPQWQQVTPQPPAFGQQPQAPSMPMPTGQQQPQVPGVPMMPQVPTLPSDQQSQTPQWAQQLLQSIDQMQQGQGDGQGSGGQRQAFDPSKPWTAENRPTSWAEMQQANQAIAANQAKEIVTQTLQQQQQQQMQQQQQEQQINQQIDQTFNRLRLTGALPTIANPNDPNDPGKQAERELLGFTLALGGKTAEDILVGATSLMQQHQMGRYFDPKSGQMQQRRGQSAAAMAPIAGGMPVMGQMGTAPGPTQSQLAHGARDLGSLMQMGMEAIQ